MIDHPTLNHIPFRVTSVADMFGVTEGDTASWEMDSP